MNRPLIQDFEDIQEIERRPYREVVPVQTTIDLIRRAAKLFGDRPAITLLPNALPSDAPLTLSYADFSQRVERTAAAFRALGIGAEDSVALLMPTITETFVGLFAAELAGRACPINYMLRADEIAEVITAARARVLVIFGPDTQLPVWQKLDDIRRLAPGLRHVIVAKSPLEATAPRAPGMTDFAELVERSVAPVEREMNAETIASYFHTGGSTGSPKLLQHTHGNEVHSSWFMGSYFDFNETDVVINGYPLFHVAGAFCYGGGCFAAGMHIVIPSHIGMRSPNLIANYWQLTDQYGVSIISAGPTLLTTILSMPPRRLARDRVKVVISGGSAMPSELARAAQTKLGVPVRNAYGMTETSGLASLEPTQTERAPDSVGWRLPYSELRIVAGGVGADADFTRPMPEGETGVILIRGPHVSPGYCDPARNRESFTSDGWFISGDLGHLDASGRLFITGRAKDVIIRGGHNIDPASIEDALIQHPDVELCAAVGEPDPYAGELPVAFVMLRAGCESTPDQILRAVRPLIAEPAAVPKRLYVISEFPMTSVGKIFRPALRRMATERVLQERVTSLLPDGASALVICKATPSQDLYSVTLHGKINANLVDQIHIELGRFPGDFEVSEGNR